MRLLFFALFFSVMALPAIAESLSDAGVRQAIIQQSLSQYPGPCPCPYNRMRNGRACGNVSAYVRPGGYAPICYDRDVTDDMLRKYKDGHSE